MRKHALLVLVVLLAGVDLHAQNDRDSLTTTTLQDVVVTGTRYDVAATKSGKTITKLSAAMLSRQTGRSLADVLNTVPGLQIDGVYGPPGSNLGYYMRGARNRQSVILIDGVPMVDASGISPEYDLRFIPLDQIESAEIMRGGLSTLYGSGAAAGVINIRLRSPQTGTHGMLHAYGGSFGTFAQSFSVSTRKDKWYTYFMLNNYASNGFSAARSNQPQIKFDNDGMKRKDALFRLGYRVNDNIDVQIFAGYDTFVADYDDGQYTDAPNQQESEQWRVGARIGINHKKGELQASVQQTSIRKEFISAYPEKYKSYGTMADVFDTYHITDQVTLVSGVSLQHLAYGQPEAVNRDTVKFTIVDPYVSAVWELPIGVTVHAGVRLNHHSVYGSNLIYNLNPSYLLKLSEQTQIKFSGSVSTAYITPSLYQLYGYYGNDKLKPEQSLAWEGAATAYTKVGSFSVAYFNRNEDQAIGFRSILDDQGNFIGGEYYNLASSRTVKGVEVENTIAVGKYITFATNYAFTTTAKRSSFYRIPYHKASVSAVAHVRKGAQVEVQYQYTGKRYDLDYSIYKEVALHDFQLINVRVSQSFIHERLTAYVNVNNLFDKDYTWSVGYSSARRNFTAGLKFSF